MDFKEILEIRNKLTDFKEAIDYFIDQISNRKQVAEQLNLLLPRHAQVLLLGIYETDDKISEKHIIYWNTLFRTQISIDTTAQLKLLFYEKDFHSLKSTVFPEPQPYKILLQNMFRTAEIFRESNLKINAPLILPKTYIEILEKIAKGALSFNPQNLSGKLLVNNHMETVRYLFEQKVLEYDSKEKNKTDEQAQIGIVNSETNDNVDDLIAELNSLIGLDIMKKEVIELVNFIKVCKLRLERKLPVPPISLHLVFSGNPGTGKTTVARLIGKIYKSLGLLEKGHLIETDRSGLVAGFVGQTALKVQEVVGSAYGGVLFIDEAYALFNAGVNDYGQEAIETLLKLMEDNRDKIAVIVAGYPEKMEEFLQSNPGLKSRFNKFISFHDYNAEEMLLIFKKMCNDSGYILPIKTEETALAIFQDMCLKKDSYFANGRSVRNLFENAITNQANRIVELKNPTDDELKSLTSIDLVD